MLKETGRFFSKTFFFFVFIVYYFDLICSIISIVWEDDEDRATVFEIIGYSGMILIVPALFALVSIGVISKAKQKSRRAALLVLVLHAILLASLRYWAYGVIFEQAMQLMVNGEFEEVITDSTICSFRPYKNPGVFRSVCMPSPEKEQEHRSLMTWYSLINLDFKIYRAMTKPQNVLFTETFCGLISFIPSTLTTFRASTSGCIPQEGSNLRFFLLKNG